MTNLTENTNYEKGIYQLEEEDLILGGPEGASNLQAKQLANRTAWLREQVNQLSSDLSNLNKENILDLHPASNQEEGLIRIATKEEAEKGEATGVAVTPQQLQSVRANIQSAKINVSTHEFFPPKKTLSTTSKVWAVAYEYEFTLSKRALVIGITSGHARVSSSHNAYIRLAFDDDPAIGKGSGPVKDGKGAIRLPRHNHLGTLDWTPVYGSESAVLEAGTHKAKVLFGSNGGTVFYNGSRIALSVIEGV